MVDTRLLKQELTMEIKDANPPLWIVLECINRMLQKTGTGIKLSAKEFEEDKTVLITLSKVDD